MIKKSIKASKACKKQYESVLAVRAKNFETYFANTTLALKHQDAHQRLLDVEKVLSIVSGRREFRLYEMACQLLADSLCQIACANYRIAFYCLRAFLEMTAAGVRYSAFEYELREWEAGRKDISWATLSGDETGCFSVNFTNAFFPGIKDESKHYQGLARRVYRECSEYVHGNPGRHVITSDFDNERTTDWFNLFSAATAAVLFSFFVRYLSELSSKGLDQDILEIVQNEIGHFSEIRALLGLEYGVKK